MSKKAHSKVERSSYILMANITRQASSVLCVEGTRIRGSAVKMSHTEP
jgi:hypothetical protein